MSERPTFQTREERKELFKIISDIKESSATLTDISRPMFNGNRFISDTELAKRLRVSKRTLANYRANGIIGFYNLEGKILYAESDIENYLKDHYLPPLL
ncbi:helix-turn-helix domain-containing protein [uncultured Duncaniella sp.]|uniref:helix-turn-helix domain-containing protein n=1 Tax=uncultured Duncaniella sp. TaxID=2768039 RepID=UPI0025B6AC4B|nr:helix-turn-helix domain-containing protein [uncultured Duncaniella sp.]